MAFKWTEVNGYTISAERPILAEVLTWATHKLKVSVNDLGAIMGMRSVGGLPGWFVLGKEPHAENLRAFADVTGIPLEELQSAVAESVRMRLDAPRSGLERAQRASRDRFYIRGPKPAGANTVASIASAPRRRRRRVALLAGLLVSAGLASQAAVIDATTAPAVTQPEVLEGALCKKRRGRLRGQRVTNPWGAAPLPNAA